MAIIWLADYCSITRQLHGVTQGSRKQNRETARYSVLLAQLERKPPVHISKHISFRFTSAKGLSTLKYC